jgi:AcrR family transcriptional regulator
MVFLLLCLAKLPPIEQKSIAVWGTLPGVARAPRKPEPDDARERARLQVDERRAQLLDLGLRLFSERSYDELSVDDIARAAGISKGLLYHYFPSKRDYYVETVRSAAQLLVDRADPPGSSGPEAEALLSGLDAYLAFAEEHATAFVALMRSGVGHDSEVAEIVESTRARFAARIAGRLGVASPGPLLRTALRGWIGACEGASLDWLEHRDLPRDVLRDHLAQLLVATLTAAGAMPDLTLPLSEST